MELRDRVLIILNPAAGRPWHARRRLGRVIAALEQHGCTVVLRQADLATGGAERLAREAEPDFTVVVAAGGDGTLNAIVNGLAGTSRTIALLPLGTANVAAHTIGLPRAPEKLAALIAYGRARPLWPGRVGGRLFVTMASSGFDAETVAAVDPCLKRYFGRLAFAWAILRCLWRYRHCSLLIRVDGVDHHAATVIVAKGSCYAGPYVIAPQASFAEPMLDLVLFRRAGRLAVVRYLGALCRGSLPRRSDITLLRCRNALISAAAPAAPVLVQADGELVGSLPIEIGVAEHPLWLVQP